MTEETVTVPAGHESMNFSFRKEKVRDSEGKDIGETKKIPSFQVPVPVPSDEDVINWLAEGASAPDAEKPKEYKLLREMISDLIKNAGRLQLNSFREENPDAVVTPTALDFSKMTFTAIASTERRERAPEIAEEVFNSMYEDYKATMLALNVPAEKINKHVVLFKNQFRAARYDKAALKFMQERLNMYAAKTENMEENADVYALLQGKLEKYINADEKNLINAL